MAFMSPLQYDIFSSFDPPPFKKWSKFDPHTENGQYLTPLYINRHKFLSKMAQIWSKIDPLYKNCQILTPYTIIAKI